jgi:hypothetical protein
VISLRSLPLVGPKAESEKAFIPSKKRFLTACARRMRVPGKKSAL